MEKQPPDCPACQGSGRNPCRSAEVCPNCEGLGKMPIEEVGGEHTTLGRDYSLVAPSQTTTQADTDE